MNQIPHLIDVRDAIAAMQRTRRHSHMLPHFKCIINIKCKFKYQ